MPDAVRSFLRMRAPLMVLGVLTLVGAPAAGEDAAPPSPEISDLLAKWLEKGDPPPPGLLVQLLRKQRDLPAQQPPGCPGLTCTPGPTPKEVKLPPAPYDPEGNDCVLVGRTAEVENYVRALEAMLRECLGFAERGYEAAVAAKALLDAQVEVLPGGGHVSHDRPSRVRVGLGWGTLPEFAAVIEAVGSRYTMFTDSASRRASTEDHHEPSRDRFRRRATGFVFTRWLEELTLEVAALCDGAHRTYEPMEDACNELNRVLCGQEGRLLDETQRAQFRERLDEAMRDVLAVLERVRAWGAWLAESCQAVLERFSVAIVCPLAPTPTDLLALLAAEKAFQDFVRTVDEQAQLAWRSRVGIVLWLGGRLFHFEVPAVLLR
jgi:hypothetical protein